MNKQTNIKTCKTCKVEKELCEYYKHKKTKDGVNSECILCVKVRMAKYRNDNKEKNYENKKINKEKYKETIKKYKETNKDYLVNYAKEYGKKYYQENKEKCKLNNAQYYQDNKEKVKETKKIWNSNNKDKINLNRKIEKNKIARNNYLNNRKKNDPLFKLGTILRSAIVTSLKGCGYSKKSKTCEILGASFDDVLIHLNNNLYGFVYGDEGLDIDNIIATSTAKTEDELLKLNHYSNLQLLPSEYNRWIKSNSTYDVEHFNNWYANNTNNIKVNYLYNVKK